MKPIPTTHLKKIKELLQQGRPYIEIARITRTGVKRVKEIHAGKSDKVKEGYWDDRTTNIFI